MNALFTSILNMSIAGGVVIAVVMLGRLLIKNAPKKWSYLLWIAAAFRLCCPVSIRSAISLFRVLPHTETARAAGETASRLSYIPSAVSAPVMTAIPVPPTVLPIEPLPMANATADPSLITANPAPITSAPILAAPITSAPVTSNPVAGAITHEAANTAASASPLQVVMTVLTVLWLVGIAALVIYAIVDYIRLRKNVATATKLAGENKVFESENIRSPFIIGIFRPRIMVPYGLTEKELQYVLAHERYHLRRGDQIIKFFSFLLLCLHWFNPLCWLAFYLMGRDMEMSCDEKVLSCGGNKAGYSSALLSFAAGKRYPAPNPLSFSETNIKGRVKNAMKYEKPKLFVTIVAVMLCIVIVAACGTNPAGEKETTNGPAGIPEGYDEHDYSLLRDYFELRDENGVRNGDKLFAAYDPADPGSWYGVPEYSEEASALEWTADGENKKLAKLVLCGPIGQPASLAGKLELRDLTELTEFRFVEITLEELCVSDCRKLETGVMPGSLVRGEAELIIPVLGSFGVSSDTSVILTCLPCSVNGVDFDFTVELLAEGGRVGFNSGAEGFMLAAASIDRSMYCTGWVDENDAVVCEGPHFIPYEGQTEFKGDFSYMPTFVKASPGNTENVRIIHRDSELHSEEEISAAIEIILNEFRTNWWGCTLENIGYAGDGAMAQYKPYSPWRDTADKDIMILTSDFTTGPDCPDISLGTDTVYPDWSWILIRNAEGRWEFVDCGFGVDPDAAPEAETVAYWPVDIDGDGVDERLAMDLKALFSEGNQAPYILLADGTEIKGFVPISPSHAGVGTYGITKRNGRGYVLEHHIQNYSGGHITDRYTLWTVENGRLVPAAQNEIEYNMAYSMDRNTNDVDAVIAYYDELDAVWRDSELAITADPFITYRCLFYEGDTSRPVSQAYMQSYIVANNAEAVRTAMSFIGYSDSDFVIAAEGKVQYHHGLGGELDDLYHEYEGYDMAWDLAEKLRFNNHVIERYWDYVEIMNYLGYENTETIELLSETLGADGVWTYFFHDSASGKTYSIVGGDPGTITEISWTFD